MMRLIVGILLLIGIITEAVGQIELLKDINENINNKPSTPSDFKIVGNNLFFKAMSGQILPGSNEELWLTDGSLEGTKQVKDIYLGPGSSSPSYLTNMGGLLYFSADNGFNGRELWKSDGTPHGTRMVKDIFLNQGSSNPTRLTVIDGTLYFVAEDGIHGRELWRSNGTAEGTLLVRDILPSNNQINPIGSYRSLTAMEDKLFIVVANGTNSELWSTDVTNQETKRIKIFPVGNLDNTIRFKDQLMFTSYSQESGYELWKSDGTGEGTMLVKDILPGKASSNPSQLAVFNNEVYFFVRDANLDVDVWKTNGTFTGTQIVTKGVSNGSASRGIEFIATEDHIYFLVEKQPNMSIESFQFWKSNGTTMGTNLVYEFDGRVQSRLAVASGIVFISSYDINTGAHLYISDGTSGGTKIISSGLYANDLLLFKDKIFFRGTNGDNDTELWRTNGTSGGTELVKDISFGNDGSNPSNLHSLDNGTGIFFANDAKHGIELWRTNGTNSGTSLVKDIWEGLDSSYPRGVVTWGGKAYFAAINEEGFGIWETDATEAGTKRRWRFTGHQPIITNLTVSDKELYFFTDGTTIHHEYFSGGLSSSSLPQVGNPIRAHLSNGKMFYSIENFSVHSLWRTEESFENTILLKSVSNELNDGFFSEMVSLENLEYFLLQENGVFQLWSTNGENEGTKKIVDITNGSKLAITVSKILVNNKTLYFILDNRYTGTLLLYRSDGSANGTYLIKEIKSSQQGEHFLDFTSIDDMLYFGAANEKNGMEPWRSDGTEVGTFMLKDIALGMEGSYSYGFTKSQGSIYFVAANRASDDGFEIWRTDGTDCGTQKVTNQSPDIQIFGMFKNLNDKIISTAVSSNSGMELYVYDPKADPPKLACQTIAFEQIQDKVLGDDQFSVNALSSSGLPVDFSSTSSKIIMMNNQVTLIESGRVTITASQAGNDSFVAAPSVDQSFCINPIKPTVGISNINSDGATLTSSSTLGNSWFFNGSIAQNFTGSEIFVSEPGSYRVQVKTDDCLSELSEDVLLVITGDIAASSQVAEIYPNPVDSYFYLIGINGEKGYVHILSAAGQYDVFRLEKIGDYYRVDVQSLSTGLYVLNFQEGNSTHNIKFIKK